MAPHIFAKVPVIHPLGDHTQPGDFHKNSKKWDNIPMRESLPEHDFFTEVLMGISSFSSLTNSNKEANLPKSFWIVDGGDSQLFDRNHTVPICAFPDKNSLSKD
jgi:hypothetical protein